MDLLPGGFGGFWFRVQAGEPPPNQPIDSVELPCPLHSQRDWLRMRLCICCRRCRPPSVRSREWPLLALPTFMSLVHESRC